MLGKIPWSSLEEPLQRSLCRRRAIAVLCLVLGISAAVCLMWIHSDPAGPYSLARLDQPLPSLVVDASGVKVDLKKFAEGVRCIIVFYSPSCRICREVLPALRPFPPALRLIMVNEAPDQEGSEISGFPNAALFHDRWRALSRSFAAAALPTILFVDEDGILRDGLAGSHGREFVQQKLKEFAVHTYDRLNKP